MEWLSGGRIPALKRNKNMVPAPKLLSAFFALTAGCGFAYSQQRDTLLGIKLRPDVRSIVKEIEDKTRQPLQADFTQLDEFQLGSSYIDDESGAVGG